MHDYRLDDIEHRTPPCLSIGLQVDGRSRHIDHSGGELPGRKVDGRR
jgi:hypothetical protein